MTDLEKALARAASLEATIEAIREVAKQSGYPTVYAIAETALAKVQDE
jgi:hypothetical protein